MVERLGRVRRDGEPAVLLDGDVLVEREPALDDMGRAHRTQHRPQGVIDGQYVCGGAARREGQHGLAGERVLRQQIEERLEHTGVRGLVDRRSDDHSVGAREEFGRRHDRRMLEVGAQQRLRRDGTDVEREHFMALEGQSSVQMAQQTAGAGGRGGAAGDGQDGGHGNSFGEWVGRLLPRHLDAFGQAERRCGEQPDSGAQPWGNGAELFTRRQQRKSPDPEPPRGRWCGDSARQRAVTQQQEALETRARSTWRRRVRSSRVCMSTIAARRRR